MSALRAAAEEYLAMRRSLGYRLVNQGRLLGNFIGYLERAGATTITIEAAVAWASESPGSQRSAGTAGCRWCGVSPVT